ncbi:MAG: NAD(P)-binding domain-containing protein [Sphingobacteriaceae bacterium]
MATKQTIAIIGAAESIGIAISKKLASGPYRLLLMGENILALRDLEADILAKYMQAEFELFICPQEACWEADIIIVTVGELGNAGLCSKIRPYATGKVVISIADPGSDALAALQKLLPYSKVISLLKSPVDRDDDNGNVIIRIAGNDADALTTVAHVIGNAGFRSVITGDLL